MSVPLCAVAKFSPKAGSLQCQLSSCLVFVVSVSVALVEYIRCSCLFVCVSVPLCAIAMISLMACSVSESWWRGGGRGSAARANICRTTSRGGAPSGVGRDESPS